MKLEKPTGAKLCEKMMSFFPAFCKNKKKKTKREEDKTNLASAQSF